MSAQTLHNRKPGRSSSFIQRLISMLDLTIEIEYVIPSKMSVVQAENVIQHHLLHGLTHVGIDFFGDKVPEKFYEGNCVDGELELNGPYFSRCNRYSPLRLTTQGRLVDAPVGCILQLRIKMAAIVLQMCEHVLPLFIVVGPWLIVMAASWVGWFAVTVLPIELAVSFFLIRYNLENEASIVHKILRDILMDAG